VNIPSEERLGVGDGRVYMKKGITRPGPLRTTVRYIYGLAATFHYTCFGAKLAKLFSVEQPQKTVYLYKTTFHFPLCWT
jgi:hypothetical protein